MDTSRLLEVLEDVEREFEGGQIKLLTAIVQQYTSARDSPTVDNGAAIGAAIASVAEYIHGGLFAEYPPSKAEILRAIGGYAYVGPGIKDRLESTISPPEQTAAGLVTLLTALVADVNTFKKSCAQVRTGLKALNFTPHTVPLGKCEVGVLMPEALVHSELSALLKELETWNKIVRIFQEVGGEKEREVTLAGLASGSYDTYLTIGIVAATFLSRTIDKVFEWYTQILKIRKLRQELEATGVPPFDVELVKKHEKDIIDNGIKALVEEILSQAPKDMEAHRKAEVKTELNIRIKHITRFVDRGGDVEVTTTPPEIIKEPEVPTDTATQTEKDLYDKQLEEHKKTIGKLKEIIRSGSALSQLATRLEPILQLETETEEEPTSQSEK